MRINSTIRIFSAVIALALFALSLYLGFRATRMQNAYIFIVDVAPYTLITDESAFLKRVEVPDDRAFNAITDPRQIVGKYTNQQVYQDQLVQVAMLVDAPPDGRRIFPYGLLPDGTLAYPIQVISEDSIKPVIQAEADVVDIIILLNDDGTPSPDDTAVLLFQKVRALGVIEEQFMVALTYPQIAAYEGWRQREGVSFTVAINQIANGDHPPLHEAPLHPDYADPGIRQQFAVATPTPAPALTSVED